MDLNPSNTPEMVLPPWLVGSLPRERLGETFGRARWALASYWLLTLSGYLVLLATAMFWWHGDLTITGMMLGVSAVGAVVGNALSLARVRPWVVQAAVHATLIGCCMSGAVGMPPLLILGLWTFLWSMGCGHLALQRRGSLWALWIPLICWTAAIVTILQHNGRLQTWQAGHKEGVWQPVTLGLLFAVVVEFFLFLAGQEHYHTQVWQGGATSVPTLLKDHRSKGATRLTGKGLAALLIFSAVTAGLVGKIAPYLWRTERREGRREERREEPRPSERPRRAPDADWDGLARSLQRAAREAKRQGENVLPFVPLFLLNRPLRRLWLLRHLRKPVIAPPPSERAHNLWRYVLIALGDAKLAPHKGEALEVVVERVARACAESNTPPPEGIAEASEIYQRIRFGLGIPTGALDALQVNAERAFESVRRPMSAWERVRCWWRKIEV